MRKLSNFFKNNKGANLVEYIILVGVVALIALAGFKIFGSKVNAKIIEFSDKTSAIGN